MCSISMCFCGDQGDCRKASSLIVCMETKMTSITQPPSPLPSSILGGGGGQLGCVFHLHLFKLDDSFYQSFVNEQN